VLRKPHAAKKKIYMLVHVFLANMDPGTRTAINGARQSVNKAIHSENVMHWLLKRKGLMFISTYAIES
jgi:hypothetical protein